MASGVPPPSWDKPPQPPPPPPEPQPAPPPSERKPRFRKASRAGPPAPGSPEKLRRRRHWGIVLVGAASTVVVHLVVYAVFARGGSYSEMIVLDYLTGLYFGFLHALWITFDSYYHGRTPGIRRWVAIFAWPPALWYHLLITRGRRGLLSILLTLLLYLAVVACIVLLAVAPGLRVWAA